MPYTRSMPLKIIYFTTLQETLLFQNAPELLNSSVNYMHHLL